MTSLDDPNQDPRPKWVPGPLIVGAGPSGIAVAACLSTLNIPSTILEKSNSIASLWQNRTYNRLKLHLPKQFCELPLIPFPSNFPKYPSKEQFMSYLESYTSAFSIQPRFGCGVKRAEFDEKVGVWRVLVENGEVFLSKWLVVASGENAVEFVPEVVGVERYGGRMMHTSGYKCGKGFRGERVLVVGCGNSGMEVALDLCRHGALPFMVVRNNVHVLPREMFGMSTFGVAMALLKWLPLKLVDKLLLAMANLILGDTNKLGLKRPKIGPLELKNLTGKTPVLDVGTLSQIISGNIKVVGGLKEITREGARFVDGKVEKFDSIIFATGYRCNVPAWLKGGNDLFTKAGMPKAQFPNGWKGERGLYCVGLTGRGLLGISSDALNIAKDLTLHWKQTNFLNPPNSNL